MISGDASLIWEAEAHHRGGAGSTAGSAKTDKDVVEMRALIEQEKPAGTSGI